MVTKMIDYLKPLGAFVENTLRPILDKLDERGIKLTSDDLKIALDSLIKSYLLASFMELLKCIAITSTVLLLLWKICQ